MGPLRSAPRLSGQGPQPSRLLPPGSNIGSNRVALPSNVIELRIIPATPEWQDAILYAIRAKPLLESTSADLRYLTTQAAIDEMTDRLRKGYTFVATQSSMGLLGLPGSMRDVAIASMNIGLDCGEHSRAT
jgi:hypothetical protein